MQYKTIILELLLQRQEMYEQLRKHKLLLATMDLYASELKSSHDHWKETLSQENPDSDPSQIASVALELALQELQERLPSASPPDDSETLSLEETIAFIRAHTQPA